MIFILAFGLLGGVCGAQERGNVQVLFSPSVGERFYDIAYELGSSERADEKEIEQAIQLLRAVLAVDEGAKYAVPTIIDFATRYIDYDLSLIHI